MQLSVTNITTIILLSILIIVILSLLSAFAVSRTRKKSQKQNETLEAGVVMGRAPKPTPDYIGDKSTRINNISIPQTTILNKSTSGYTTNIGFPDSGKAHLKIEVVKIVDSENDLSRPYYGNTSPGEG